MASSIKVILRKKKNKDGLYPEQHLLKSATKLRQCLRIGVKEHLGFYF